MIFCCTPLQVTIGVLSIVVATGGLSIPTMGSSDFGYITAQRYGHQVRSMRASLVPFTWNNRDKPTWSALSGVSTQVRACAMNGTEFLLDALITHRGMSGPALLQISNYWQEGEPLIIDWLPNVSITERIAQDRHTQGKRLISTLLSELLPTRLALHIAQQVGLTHTSLATLTRVDVSRLHRFIHEWLFQPGGTEGYRTAEVTLAGVDTHAISSKTMA